MTAFRRPQRGTLLGDTVDMSGICDGLARRLGTRQRRYNVRVASTSAIR
jgi:hypothetical protein